LIARFSKGEKQERFGPHLAHRASTPKGLAMNNIVYIVGLVVVVVAVLSFFGLR
jgi:hypothetical protein